LRRPAPSGFAKWTPGLLTNYLALWAVVITIAVLMPNRFLTPEVRSITITLGTLGIWRFGWWFLHALRAEYFRRLKWPPMRRAASALWAAGWRPRRVHIQMTTYYEEPAITRAVIGSILQQVRREGIPVSLWIGTGSSYDELIIRDYVETHGADLTAGLMDLTFVRQNQPGKRMAIGLILRGMARRGVDPDDLVIFMDGDAVYGGDVLEKTLSMFGADPELQALTTDEEVMCYGPR
jgi:glycosyltransferase Alg8